LLTRLEVDGFKNLVDFTVDFGPFTCIAGPNGVGKSNIFDAIRLLSLLTEHSLMEAAMRVRGGDTETGDMQNLFWARGDARAESFKIAADMIVEPKVRDDFGRPAEATSTYLRYEIEIGYEPPAHKGTLGRLMLRSESLNYITEGDAVTRLKFPHSANQFSACGGREQTAQPSRIYLNLYSGPGANRDRGASGRRLAWPWADRIGRFGSPHHRRDLEYLRNPDHPGGAPGDAALEVPGLGAVGDAAAGSLSVRPFYHS
jgi:energy-coupling factor transporter ATP-binding protein EcfA2